MKRTLLVELDIPPDISIADLALDVQEILADSLNFPVTSVKPWSSPNDAESQGLRPPTQAISTMRHEPTTPTRNTIY